jgi:ribonucleoside-diphosphate reductase alpha chain
VLGLGFVQDVLGASDADLQDPAFHTLSAAGFSDETIAEAQAWVFGVGALDGLPGVAPDQARVFDGADQISDAARLAMSGAVDAVSTSPCLTVLGLDWTTSAADVAALHADAARLGVRALRLLRGAPPLLAFDLPEPEAASRRAAPPVVAERVVEKIVERDRSRLKLPDRRRATSRRPRSAATRSTCTPASTTTAPSARCSSTCIRRAPPSDR